MNWICERNSVVPSLKVIESDTDRSVTYDFLLVIHSNYDLSCTISEINGNTNRKTQKVTT